MKVYQLIKRLQKLSPVATVILSSDEEGNRYERLHEVVDAIDKYYDKNDHYICTKDKDTSASKNTVDDIVILYPE